MEQTECSETSAYKLQTPRNYSEESIQHSEHGESLKSSTLPLLSVKSRMMFLWEKAGRLREMINSDVIELEKVNGRDHLVYSNLDGK